MIQSNRGTLAIVSSSAAITGRSSSPSAECPFDGVGICGPGVANQSHFCANQFAACGLTDALRTELCEYGLDGINVFWACVHLNMIDATVFRSVTNVLRRRMPSDGPLQRADAFQTAAMSSSQASECGLQDHRRHLSKRFDPVRPVLSWRCFLSARPAAHADIQLVLCAPGLIRMAQPP